MQRSQVLTISLLQSPFLVKIMLTIVFLKLGFITLALIFQPEGFIVSISILVMIIMSVIALVAYILLTAISIYQVLVGFPDLVSLRWSKLYKGNNYYFLNLIMSVNLIFLCFMLFNDNKFSSGLGTIYFLGHLFLVADLLWVLEHGFSISLNH